VRLAPWPRGVLGHRGDMTVEHRSAQVLPLWLLVTGMAAIVQEVGR